MISNFSFLEARYPLIYTPAVKAERYLLTDPRAAAMYARLCLEEFIRHLYQADAQLVPPTKPEGQHPTLDDLMRNPVLEVILPPLLLKQLHFIRKQGNRCLHDLNYQLTLPQGINMLKGLYDMGKWCVEMFEEEVIDEPFQEGLLPANPTALTASEKRNLEQRIEQNQVLLAARETQLEQAQQRNEALQTELSLRRNRINSTWTGSLSETETRQLFIDVMLQEAGYDPQHPRNREVTLTGLPNGKTGRADYVFWEKDGKPLAVIEAKKTMSDARQGEQQAEQYATALEGMFGQRPVIFYTNGFDTWLWDDAAGYPPRLVQGFYQQADLEWLIQRRHNRLPLGNQPVNKSITDRYYQEEAIRRATEHWQARHRRVLLEMATGSGKTRTASALVELMAKAGWIKRVLFLADRTALVTQAKGSFGTYLPTIAGINLAELAPEDDPFTARLVFSTYQTLMNSIDTDWEGNRRRYSPGHFDLIIIDEAHRSIYQKYGAIFDYFDALLLGLTATPKSDIDRDTYQFFNLPTGDPTYAYSLEQAVIDGYLVPYKAVEVNLRFPVEGIVYDQLSDEEKAEYEDKFEANGILPSQIEPAALNTWLFNTGTVDEVLDYLMSHGIKIEGGDRLGKSILFARNHLHAVFVKERFDVLYPEYGGNFCKIIDTHQQNPQALINEFSNPKNRDFQLAISVDMLDTGIDIPEVVNLVFFKRVMSKAKFWQMIGRGTRLCENLFAPGKHKTHFQIFDFCSNFAFFGENPEGIPATEQVSLSEKIFKARLDLSQTLSNTQTEQAYRLSLLKGLQADIAQLNDTSFVIQRKKEWLHRYRSLSTWEFLSPQEVLEIKTHLAPLVRYPNQDETARQFDLLMLNLQQALLTQSLELPTLTSRVQQLARGILPKANIPKVNQQEPLLRRLAEQDYWNNATLTDLEQVRQKVRDLIIFIDKDAQRPVYTTFADSLVSVKVVGDPMPPYTNLEVYKSRVERMIRENKDHLVIRKLINNMPITGTELAALDQMLFAGVDFPDRELFEKVVGEKPLGVFIRSILGLEQQAAKTAFAHFQSQVMLTANQSQFINFIIDALCRQGVVDTNQFFESPFTDLHSQGLAGLFSEEEAQNIISIIKTVNANAEALPNN